MNKVTVKGREEKREKIGVGSLWRHHNRTGIYILAYGWNHRILMINLRDGEAYSNKVINAANEDDLTEKEWSEVCGGSPEDFSPIYHVEIEAERG